MVRKTYQLDTLAGQIEAAFDFRGDVTITLQDGTAVDGFIFNRNLSPKAGAPYIELFVAGQHQAARHEVSRIRTIALTGEDTAAGKSWENWIARQEAKKTGG